MNGIKKILIGSLLMIVSALAIFAASPNLYADCAGDGSIKGALECGTSNTSGVPTGTDPQTNINDTISRAINLLSVGVGIISTVMIVFAGFKYVTSAGDTTKVASAKSTLIYAVIGLFLVVLAETIVKFVLHKATLV